MNASPIAQRMRMPVFQSIPAGIIGNEIEIFYHGITVYALIAGCCVAFTGWPETLLSILEEDLVKHPLAIMALIEMGVHSRLEKLWFYARCRFGSFDGNADIDGNGHIKHTEYWDCGLRGKCAYEGRLCSHMKVANGKLTPREIDVILLVVDDLMNKEIADALNISPKTVPVHVNKIIRKIDGKRKADIIKFAIAHNITNSQKQLI